MDVLANHSIFQELQIVHDTGYFSAMPSLEENWQQVMSQLSILAGVHPSLQRFNRTVRPADGFTRARRYRRQLFPSAWTCVVRGEMRRRNALYHSYI